MVNTEAFDIMNKLDDFKNKIAGAKIAVLGLGISNVPLIRFLYNSGARNITAYDKFASPQVIANIDILNKEGMIERAVTGEDYLEGIPSEKYDIIFKSPIIRPDVEPLVKAVEQGAVLTSEMELFFELCPCKTYGITGSDGKTTTTTLTHKLLSAHYEGTDTKVWLGGNIGRPLIDILPEIKSSDAAVLELSSFQLMTMKKSPDVSVITNITPNHLDVHKDYEEYIEAKKKIFKHQNSDGVIVLNAKNDVTAAISSECIAQHKNVRMFSVSNCGVDDFEKGADGYGYMKDGKLEYASESADGFAAKFSIARTELKVPGNFNGENLLTAIAACADVITQEDIVKVTNEFKGVPHRCELIREFNGVKYYNSSIDSSPNRTIQTLSVFDGNVVMIAGGKDKNIPYDAIGPVICEKVKVLILIGPTAEKIETAVRNSEKFNEKNIKIFHFNNYKDAVQCAHDNSVSGDCVLLSSASTSFDLFKNFEERGKVFKELVLGL